ncbi:unnamed protein product [Ectocarpus sp. 12 AP-2014]
MVVMSRRNNTFARCRNFALPRTRIDGTIHPTFPTPTTSIFVCGATRYDHDCTTKPAAVGLVECVVPRSAHRLQSRLAASFQRDSLSCFCRRPPRSFSIWLLFLSYAGTAASISNLDALHRTVAYRKAHVLQRGGDNKVRCWILLKERTSPTVSFG